MFYTGWSPLLTLHDWDVAAVDDVAAEKDVALSGNLSVLVARRQQLRSGPLSPLARAAVGAGIATASSSSSPSSASALVAQEYFGQGVSTLRFLSPSLTTSPMRATPAPSTRSANQRAAEVFAATHQRFHIKSRTPLPQHCGLLYVECQVLAVGTGSTTTTTTTEAGDDKQAGAASSGARRVPMLPLALGVCTASLPSHLVPGEASDSIGFLPGSRVVYEHGHTEPERLSFNLPATAPLSSDRAPPPRRRRRQQQQQQAEHPENEHTPFTSDAIRAATEPQDPSSVRLGNSSSSSSSGSSICSTSTSDSDEDSPDSRVVAAVRDDASGDGKASLRSAASPLSPSSPAAASHPRRALEAGDAVGCLVDLHDGTVRFTVNGVLLHGYVGHIPTGSANSASSSTQRTATLGVPPASSSPSPAYFFSIGVTQRTPSLTLRVVLQVGLNARPRLVLSPRVQQTAAASPAVNGEADVNHLHNNGERENGAVATQRVTVLFPLRRFLRRRGTRAVRAQQQEHEHEQHAAGTDNGDEAHLLTGESDADTSTHLDNTHKGDEAALGTDKTWASMVSAIATTTTTTTGPYRSHDAPWHEDDDLDDAVMITLVHRHFAARGMHRAAAAVEREALSMCMRDACRYDGDDTTDAVDAAGKGGCRAGNACAFVDYMASLRDYVLTGSTAPTTTKTTSTSSSLMETFLTRLPVSDAVEARLVQYAHHLSPHPHTAVSPFTTITSRHLSAYVLSRRPELAALLLSVPLVEDVLTEAIRCLTTTTTTTTTTMDADAEASFVVSPTRVWLRCLTDVLRPLRALATVPNPPCSDVSITSNQKNQDATLTPPSLSEEASRAGPPFALAMPILLQAALAPSSLSQPAQSCDDEGRVPTNSHVAVAQALIALLQLVQRIVVTAIVNNDLRGAAARILLAGRTAMRWHVWQKLSHGVEKVNEDMLLVLSRWELALLTEEAVDKDAVDPDEDGTVTRETTPQDEETDDGGEAVAALDEYATGALQVGPVDAAAHHDDHDDEEEEEEEEEEDYGDEGLYDLDLYQEHDSDELDPAVYAEGQLDDDDDREGEEEQRNEEEEEVEEAERMPRSDQTAGLRGEREAEEEAAHHGHLEPTASQPRTARQKRHRRGRQARQTAVSSATSDGRPRDYYFTSARFAAGQQQQRRLAAQPWSALSLRGAWRRVCVVAALQPEHYTSTMAFLSLWRRSERRLGKGRCRAAAASMGGAGEDKGEEENVFSDASAGLLVELEAQLRHIYDLL